MTRAQALLAAYQQNPRPMLLFLVLRELVEQLHETQTALATLRDGVEVLTAGVYELRRQSPH